MKSRMITMACIISIAALLGGCGSASKESAKTSDGSKISNITIDTTVAAPTETAEPVYNTPEEPETSGEDTVSAALNAYKGILATNPAMEGDPEVLYDAAFSYDDNYAMFGEHIDCFAIMDINCDEMPELIAMTKINFRWTIASIFTYVDGDTVRLKDPYNEWVEGTFDQCSTANGAYDLYICPEHHIHNVWSGANPMGELEEENQAYELNGMTLIPVGCTAGPAVSFGDIAEANRPENLNF